MIGQQKDQRGVRHFALAIAQILVHVDERFVKIVRMQQIRHLHDRLRIEQQRPDHGALGLSEQALGQFQPAHIHECLSDVVTEHAQRHFLIVRCARFCLFDDFHVYIGSLLGPIHFREDLSHVEMQQKVTRITAMQKLRILQRFVIELLDPLLPPPEHHAHCRSAALRTARGGAQSTRRRSTAQRLSSAPLLQWSPCQPRW